MRVISELEVLRTANSAFKRKQERIALVPTMGNLHDGHLHLVRIAKTLADRVIVTIFVNPAQFGPGEDFERYPRTPEEDSAALEAAGADILFMPKADEVYPRPLSSMTVVDVPGLSEDLCGACRPGHFRGVATIVLKLFNMVGPDCAVFGEKDFQQLEVIRRMVADLNLPIEIHGIPTVREASGLAMSSRNAYLNATERDLAPMIYQTLVSLGNALMRGVFSPCEAEASGYATLKEAGFGVDYFAVRRAFDLAQPSETESPEGLVLLVAARIGKARLIDNLRLSDLP